MKPIIIGEDAELQRGRLAAAGRALHQGGWLPGGAGSLSVRCGDAVAITAGDLDGAAPTRHDTVLIEPGEGLPLLGEVAWPPAETALHLVLYRRLPTCGAVIHTQAPPAAALAALAGKTGAAASAGSAGALAEVFLGQGDAPESSYPAPETGPRTGPVTVPVFANWPEAHRIAEDVAAYFDKHAGTPAEDTPPALLIDGYGVTAWGRDLDEARRRLDRIEALGRGRVLA
ncbi:class II aldolase/adducin family protein [Streptomyces sp. RS10V-4]|uniref:class II aldolase/adducin family protein n=1 Tax=Streptomyces rhizoryzae TaxID=2932493 RepID=UPI0020032C5E|nr:class II aldolase/adducin family protein [Streptomyces rhizoryzae]MCK7624298.1 class II aldolase/adducin family protein [Streptomyces rhizoryzae]